ncbi:MAG: hypothetical protein RL240_4369 [Planctomycetota bacterium]|jgi:hypothetical protein
MKDPINNGPVALLAVAEKLEKGDCQVQERRSRWYY